MMANELGVHKLKIEGDKRYKLCHGIQVDPIGN